MNWLKSLLSLAASSKEPRSNPSDPRKTLIPEFSVKQLETRRVLNGDGFVSELVVDAGSDAADGQADSFQLQIDQGQVEVSVNGRVVNQVSTDGLNAIRLQGSSDQDDFLVQWGSGADSDMEIIVDGGGGESDQLRLASLDRVDRLLHFLEADGAGQIQLNAGDASSRLRYSGVSEVEQSVQVDRLDVRLETEHRSLVLDSIGRDDHTGLIESTRLRLSEFDDAALSTSQSFVLSFLDPADHLELDARESGLKRAEFGALSETFNSSFAFYGSRADVSFTEDTSFGSGEILVQANAVTIDSALNSDGGDFRFEAEGNIVVTRQGLIDSRGGNVSLESASIALDGVVRSRGGSVSIDSGTEGVSIVRGVIDVSDSRDGRVGGTVHVLGADVALLDAARVDASGAGGGGTILIGGDYQGRNPGVHNATRTRVVQSVVLAADASVDGDGGQVIVWSDGRTDFGGEVFARGGFLGSGGFVEVSGKGALAFNGSVDVTADSGETGRLLLDPKNIVIDNGAGTTDATTTYMTAMSIVVLLQSANVDLLADNDITVAAEVNALLNTNNHNLTLTAGRSLFIQQDISLRGSFVGTANASGGDASARDAGAAVLSMDSGADIFTDLFGNDISLVMSNGFNSGGKLSGNISIDDLDAGSGTLTVTNNGETDGSSILRTSVGSNVLAATVNLSIDDVTAGDGVTNLTGSIGTSANEILLEHVTNFSVVNEAGDTFIDDKDLDLGGTTLTGVTSSNGDFSYDSDGAVTVNAVNTAGEVIVVAGTGNVVLADNAINAGSHVRLTATNGSILEQDAGAATNVTATGTLVLSAATGIGTTGGGAIDTAVVSIAARTTSNGDIVINESDGLIVASGTIGGGTGTITGIASGSGDITIATGIGTTQINEGITGENIAISAGGEVDVAAGKTILAGGNGTTLSINAASIVLNDSTRNNEAIRNTGSGTVALVANSGDITLGDHSIHLAAAHLAINAGTNDIIVSNLTSNREIEADSSVELTAGAIGTSANRLEIDNVTALTINDTAAGDIYIQEFADDTILSTTVNVSDVSLGAISIDYDNADEIAVGDSHAITSVVHNNTNRDFTYVAIAGDITLQGINAGTADVSVTAQAGSIHESGTDPSIDIAGDELTLSARDEIGSSSAMIDLNVIRLSAQTTTDGGIFLSEANGMIIDGSGISTAGSRDIQILSASGTLQVAQEINASGGNVQLDSATLNIDASITGAGIDLNASGSVDVAAGTRVIASGAGDLTIDGSSIRVNAGGLNTETVTHTGTGNLLLTSVAGNQTLDHHAIGRDGNGAISLDAANRSIVLVNNSGTEEIRASGAVSVTAAVVGTSTRALEISGATSLAVTDTAAGVINIAELGVATITSTDITVDDVGFGTIDIVFGDSETVDIDTDHDINSVDFSTSNRGFRYTATSGDVEINSINTGSADVTITASSGGISEESNDATVNVTTTGSVTLISATGIGDGVGNDALDVNAGTVAVRMTGAGDVFLASGGGLSVGAGNGVSGISTSAAGTNVDISVVGDLTVGESIVAGTGNVMLNGNNVSVENDVSGAVISISATNSISVLAGHEVIASGTDNDVTLQAGSISLEAGGDGNESVQSLAGDVLVTATAGNLSLDHHSIAATTGDVTIDVGTNQIDIAQATGSAEVSLGGTLSLTAAQIGTSSNALDLSGATLVNLSDTGAGAIYLAEQNGNSVTNADITVGDDSYGIVEIDFHDDDQIAIADSHEIASVDLTHSDRSFHYAATTGDVTIGSVATTTANLAVTALDGTITDLADDALADLTTTGILTLSSSKGIGSLVGNGAVEVNVGVLAATSTVEGDVSIVATGNMAVGAGTGVNGVSAAAGGSVRLSASGVFDVSVGSQITAGGNGTTLAIQADRIDLTAGSAGSETVRNDGTGAVSLTTIGQDISLDHHSVGSVSGNISLDAGANRILALQPSGTSEINTTGEIELTGSTIGESANVIDLFGASSLVINDTGAGEINIAEVTANTITSTSVTVGNTGYGTIAIDYFNTDLVDLQGNHSINSVVHQGFNRAFLYSATAGNIALGDSAINSGSGNVSLRSVSGTITESGNNGTRDITSSGTVTLFAASGIGTMGLGAIDVDVAQLAAETTSASGIYINELNGVIIGTGDGVDGLTTQGGEIHVDSASGTMQVSSSIGAGLGDVTLLGTNVAISADVQGENLTVDASGTFNLTGSGRLIPGGQDTTLSVSAASISVSDGSLGNETLKNTGNGTVSLTADSGNVQLGSFAVASDSGAISISAALGGIAESTAGDDRNIATSGTLTLTARDAIGATGGVNVAGTGPLDIAVGTVVAQSSTSGGVYLKDTGGLTISDVDTASGDVEIRSDGAINVTDILANGNVTLFSSGGDLSLADSSINAGAFSVNLTTTTGSISEVSSTGTASIISTDTVTLSAATGVGTSTNSLNLNVTSVAAETGNGGIYLQDSNALTIAAGSAGVSGLATGNDTPIHVALANGTLQIDASVDAGQGDVFLSAPDITVNADMQGGQIDLDADNLVQVLAGNQIETNASGANALTLDGQTVVVESGTVSKRSLVSTGGGEISITASVGDVTLGAEAIDGGAGQVRITSAASIAEQTPTGTTSIHTNGTLTLVAANSIGATGGTDISGQGPLDIEVDRLDATVSGAGGIFVRDTGGLTITDIDGASSNIEIRSTGAVAVEDLDTTGTVHLIADTGNLSLNDGAIATSMDVFLSATAGSIVETSNTDAVNITTSGILSLRAGTGVGSDSATAIDTQVTTLVARATSAGGGIFVRDVDGLVIGADSLGNVGLQTNDGAIGIESASGTFQLSESVSAGSGNVTLSGNTILVNDDVSGGSLDVNASGAVTVAAGSRLTGGGNGTSISIDAASITIQAGADNLETIQNTGAGSISLNASTGNIMLPEHGIATDSGLITLVSQSGSISENSSGTETTVSTTGTLTLSANLGIGGAGVNQGISTDVGTLAAQTASGGVYVDELSGLIIDAGDTVASSVVSGVTASGGVRITTGGNFETRASIDSNGSPIGLVGQNFTIGGDIRGGSIDIAAGGTLTVSTGRQIVGGGDSTAVTLSATTVSFNGGSAGNETVQNTGDGTVSVTVSTGDFSLQQGAIGVQQGGVSITATAGAIVESVVGTTTSIVTSGVLTLNASTGIGTNAANGEIDTAIGTIAATTTTGGIYLIDSGDLTVGQGAGGVAGLSSGSGGDVRVTSGGTLQVDESVNAGTGSVSLAGNMVQINATTQGSNAEITSTGLVSVASGVQLLSGGNGTSLTISGGNVQLGTGADGFETLRNSGTGTVSVTASSGDIDLNHFSIGAQTGSVALDAGSNAIDVASTSGVAEIKSQGAVAVTAARIGGASNALDLDGTTALTITDTGAGSIHLAELNASTIAATTVVVGDLGFGTIDVDYFDAAGVDINGDHVLTVLHDGTDRDFSYTAGSGDIRLSDNAVNAGGASVSITALNGSILEATTGTAVNITTTGSVTLDASGAIGGSGTNEAIDTDVGTLALRSTSADGIHLNELNDVEIGVGVGAINGITSSGGDVSVAAGGTATVSEDVAAGAAKISLTANELAINAQLSGDNVELISTNSVAVSNGSRVVASGSGTAIDIRAATISLGTGISNDETLESTGAGSIQLESTAGTILLDPFAIGSDSGETTIDAGSGSIVVANASGTSEIRAQGLVELTAAAVGSATNQLEIEGATGLTINDQGVGAIHVAELGSATITQTSIAVAGSFFGTLDVVYSNADGIDIDDGNQIISVDHSNGDRGFSYTAAAGNVSLSDNAIDTGSGDITITSTSGSIVELTPSTNVNVVTSGVLTLSAATGIGQSSVDGSIDTQVQSIAAETTGSGGIFVAEQNGVTITSGAGGVSGLTTAAGGDIAFSSAGGTTIVDESIDADSGAVNLTVGALTVDADIVGSSIEIDATGIVDVRVGNQLIADSATNAITISASSASLAVGSSGSETLLGNGGGLISVTTTSGDINLDAFAVRSVGGSVELDAGSSDIVVSQSTADPEISVSEDLILGASAIGSASNALDIENAKTLSVTDNGAGGIFLTELNSATIASTSFVVASGAGTIDVAFSNADIIDIDDNHLLSSVQLDAANRRFSYQALGGDILLTDDAVNTGSGNVVLDSLLGGISESISGTATKITTLGSLTLSAASNIGGSVGDQAIDTDVATIAVRTTGAGGIFVNEIDDLVVGLGENGLQGITTNGGNIDLTSGADDLRVSSDISAASGNVTLRGTNFDIDADVSGGAIDLIATGDVNIGSGNQITSTVAGTNISIQGSTIQLGEGTTDNETVKKSASGTITLTTIGGDIQLGQHAIGADNGDVTLDASTQGIFVSQASGSAEIASEGAVDITAAFVGSSSNRLELDGATQLRVRDTGSGGINLGEVDTATIASTDIVVDNTGLGTIDITYSDLDVVDINNSHAIESVIHRNGNRDFAYTASIGGISINSIDAGTADVVLVASDGAIAESFASSATNVTADTVTLSSSQGIGSSGVSGALDIAASTLAAQVSSTGGIYVNELDGLIVGIGGAGVSGVTTSNDSDVVLSATSGTLQIVRAVNAGGGDVTITGGVIDADADVSGARVNLQASGDVNVAAGVQISSVSGEVAITSDSGAIQLGSGSNGNETVSNQIAGTISLTAANIIVDHHSIGGDGQISLDAGSGVISVAQATGTVEINGAAALSVTAAAIGSSTNELEFSGASTLTIQDTGAGDIHLAESNGASVQSTSITVDGVSMGDIDIDFDGSDVVDINDGHGLINVDLSVSNQAFGYIAGSGDIAVGSIDTGSGDTFLSAASGAIADSSTDAITDIRTSGTLTLLASGDIGESGTNQEIDIDVQTLAAQSTGTGGIFLSEADNVIVSSGASGIQGVTTNGGDLNISSVGTLQVDEAINAGTGSLVLIGNDFDLNADILGGNVSLDSSGAFNLASGTRVIAGGDGTNLTIKASVIEIEDGTSSNSAVQNTGSGGITLNATGGNVLLGDHAIQSGSGDVAIVASAGSIDERNDNSNAKVSTAGNLNLQSLNSIGASSNNGTQPTEPLDVLVGSLTASVSGVGGIFVSDADGVRLTGLSTTDGAIEIESLGTLVIENAVTANGSGDVVLSGSKLEFQADGDVTSASGELAITATTSGGLSFDDDTLLTTNQGQVSGQLFNSSNPFGNSANVGAPLSDSNRDATINVALDDSFGTNITVEVNFAEGDVITPTPVVPPQNLRAQFVQGEIAVATTGMQFSHTYENAPDPSNPSANINIGLSIAELAGGAIQLLSGGQSLLASSTFASQTLVIEVSAPILPFFISIPDTDVTELVAPTVQLAGADRVLQRVFVTESPQELSNSIGTTNNSTQRYYVLRIVSFGDEGEVKLTQEGQEYRLRDLSDPNSDTGFELSQLPELFKRLPDDRYRIYLIDGQTERLVLDFIIRDGQPIEAQNDDSEAGLASQETQEEMEGERQAAETADTEEAVLSSIHDEIKQLGSTPVLRSGGVIMSAGMLAGLVGAKKTTRDNAGGSHSKSKGLNR